MSIEAYVGLVFLAVLEFFAFALFLGGYGILKNSWRDAVEASMAFSMIAFGVFIALLPVAIIVFGVTH